VGGTKKLHKDIPGPACDGEWYIYYSKNAINTLEETLNRFENRTVYPFPVN
jgi:hypothetical protein